MDGTLGLFGISMVPDLSKNPMIALGNSQIYMSWFLSNKVDRD